MSRIAVAFRSFPGAPDDTRFISFTRADLAHAAVAVGRDWRQRGIDRAERAHINERVNAIRSIVAHVDGGRIEVTSLYRTLGTTERGKKSFLLGNTLCALIAGKELDIPWLVDLEQRGHPYRVRLRPGYNRADFIGLTSHGRWYAFEAKGRSSPPGRKQIARWKSQARMVSRVNGQRVRGNIVSAALVKDDDAIEALWIDPPAKQDGEVDLPERRFFASYYVPILRFIDSGKPAMEANGEPLMYIPNLAMHIGLHSLIRRALVRRDPTSIIAFARRHSGASEPGDSRAEGADYGEAQVFSDGLIIKLDRGW